MTLTVINILRTKWWRFADLTCEPVFLWKLRRAVGLLALFVVVGWLVSCTLLGIMNPRGGWEPTRSQEAYYTLYLPTTSKPFSAFGQ